MLKYFTTKYEEETQKGLNLYLSNYYLNQEEHNGNGYKNVKILEKSSDYKDIMDMLVQSIKLNKNGGYKKTRTNKKSNKTKKNLESKINNNCIYYMPYTKKRNLKKKNTRRRGGSVRPKPSSVRPHPYGQTSRNNSSFSVMNVIHSIHKGMPKSLTGIYRDGTPEQKQQRYLALIHKYDSALRIYPQFGKKLEKGKKLYEDLLKKVQDEMMGNPANADNQANAGNEANAGKQARALQSAKTLELRQSYSGSPTEFQQHPLEGFINDIVSNNKNSNQAISALSRDFTDNELDHLIHVMPANIKQGFLVKLQEYKIKNPDNDISKLLKYF